MPAPANGATTEPVAAAAAPRALRRLADLPGPRGLPLLGNVLQFRMPRVHRDLEELARQHGPLMRVQFGPLPLLVVADHELAAQLLRERPDGFRRPSVIANVVGEMGIAQGLFTAEGEVWKNQRRMVMAAFSPTNVRAYFPALVKVAQRLQGRWSQAAGAGQVIDLQADLMRFTVDAIAGLAFGAEVNTLESDEEVIQRHLDKLFPALFRRINALVPYWRFVKLPADRELDRSMAAVLQAVDGFIAQARARLHGEPGRQPANLLEAMVVAADEPGSGMGHADLVGNVLTMLLAGEDTTANTLAWMIHLLHRHPQALMRARQELADRGYEPATATPEDLAGLDYLEACVHETMRLKPVAPFLSLEALRDTVVADVALPRGSLIICLTRLPALDDRHFPQGLSFRPERWLEGEGGTVGDAAGVPGAAKRISMPFGSGPRVCPGRYLALQEIKLAAAMLLSRFDILDVSAPGGGEAEEVMSFTMTPAGLRMRLHERA